MTNDILPVMLLTFLIGLATAVGDGFARLTRRNLKLDLT